MANALYPKTKAKFLKADIDMESIDVRAILVDLADYTYSAAHDFLDDVPAAARVAVSPALTAKAVSADGWFDSDDPILTAVNGDQLEAIILYHHTGTESTSELIAFIDTGVTGLPLTPDGSDVQIVVDAAGWFAL